MILYHYTAGQNLNAIAKHGLTVGDVPTDILRNRGCVGVWFTTSPQATGHGLPSLPTDDKQRFRLTVEVGPSPLLVRWSEWAPGNVAPATIHNLKVGASRNGLSQWETWFVHFGVVSPASILACHDMTTEKKIDAWADQWPAALNTPSVPAWRRQAWHNQLLKRTGAYLRAVNAKGFKVAV